MQQLLLGNEAIAQGAIDAGISGIYAYPGTPSTEIMEYVQYKEKIDNLGIHCTWSTNEKTAMESALGMSYAGKRVIVCMKHVGLNVAADPFMNSALTGVNGGFIVVSADDPSMHSSQNEQDSRVFGKFALLPVLEPSNQQEAYDMVHYGLDISEQLKIPVLIRITTRLAHSRTGVSRKEKRAQNMLKTPEIQNQFMLLPFNARLRYKNLLNLQAIFEQNTHDSKFNQFISAPNHQIGIIACGIAFNYVLENAIDGKLNYPLLKISQYPVPKRTIEQISSVCSTLLIFEEGYPYIEEQLIGLINHQITIKGRLSGDVPRDGELNPTIVGKAMGMVPEISMKVPDVVVNRPPMLCKGCSHIDTFNALNEAMITYPQDRVFSDIGCYTLGALPPYNSINTCVDMGASITMAKGAADAGLSPAIAVIGDSTFTHSGMTGLLDAVIENSPIKIIICDNETTGMTGGQNSSATGRLEQICLGLGVPREHLKLIIPIRKNHHENVRILTEEFEYKGLSVIISQRECIQVAIHHKNIN